MPSWRRSCGVWRTRIARNERLGPARSILDALRHGRDHGMSRAIRSCLSGVVFIFLSLLVGQADAQTNSPPPAGMTQQQYDDLVKSVGESVLQTLTKKGLVAKPSGSPLAAKPI